LAIFSTTSPTVIPVFFTVKDGGQYPSRIAVAADSLRVGSVLHRRLPNDHRHGPDVISSSIEQRICCGCRRLTFDVQVIQVGIIDETKVHVAVST